ncbi:unnamed protein product [Macrosiphum euphorbiae]|uniref:Uncharacterized protein n=1 Tax=Macrosiphum euphorbiae TaxID=13131 RepID=A0AAV0XKI8_9HEMI|nr:unnamed protein product [Macrosiphum euphorbiae]
MLSSIKVSSISDNDLFYKKVNISETEQSTIYMNYSSDEIHQKSLDLEVNAFYIYVNCKFSSWTIYELYYFVNKFPSFYSNTFPNSSIEKSVFSTEFEKLRDILENILIHIERYINELNTFINKKPKFSYYSDKSILDELLLLKLKLHYITTNRNLLDNTIIGMVLGTMNAIQRFLTINCNDSPPNYEDPHFYGYSIVKNNSETDIYNFLQLIEKNDVKFDPENQTTCTIYEILLGSIAEKIFYGATIQAEVSTTETKSIIFSDYLMDVLESYDIESISRYQRTVFNGIIQLIYTLIIILNANSKINENLNELCSPIIEELKHIEDVPKDFVICMNELSNLFLETAVKEDIIENINNHIESLNSKMKFDYTTAKIDDVQNKLLDTLKVISSKIGEFQCFNQYFKQSHYEHKNRYYKPFTKNTKIIETQTESEFYMESFCSFTKSIYKICFEITILNNKGASSEKNSSLKLYTEVLNDFQAIKEYLFRLIRKMGTKNLELLKTASNIIIILENRNNYFRDISSNINRLAHIVMNELDRYGIKYCKPGKYNFLHINNIYYSEFGNKNVITKDINQFLADRPETKYNYNHFNLSFLYNKFVKESVVFPYYKDLIMVYWKGERINIEKFSIIEGSYILNPDLLYAFFDIYFKYYVAAYLYELRHLCNFIKNNRYTSKNITTIDFEEEEFPEDLRSFIVKLKYLEKLLVTIKEDEHKVKLVSKVDNLLQNIELQFDEFGFDFVYKIKQNESYTRTNLILISSDIPAKVKEFNNYYYLLINPKPQEIVEDST